MSERYEIERKIVRVNEPGIFAAAVSWFMDGVKDSLVTIFGGDEVIRDINYKDKIEQKS